MPGAVLTDDGGDGFWIFLGEVKVQGNQGVQGV